MTQNIDTVAEQQIRIGDLERQVEELKRRVEENNMQRTACDWLDL